MKSSPYAVFRSNPLRGLFGVLAWRQSYLNIVYLILGFPLGLAYFVFYVTGGALGIGLLIVTVGAAILLLLILAAQWLGVFERLLAVHLLGVPIAPGHTPWNEGQSLGRYLKAVLRNRTTWTGLFYLLLKFPLGLASWIVTIVALSVTLGLIAAPVVDALGGNVMLWRWVPVTTEELLLVSLIGLAMVVPVIHLLNGLAWLWGRFARVMLGGREPAGPALAAESRLPPNGQPSLLPA
ncbi:MAG TPA: sensor domain-containing protein [Gemmatimonadota bacterium]|nr:sensor domain-containing protein [Gemmatimonadota bacterium]